MKRIVFALVMTSAMFLQGCGHRQFSKGEYDDVEQENLLNDSWSETDMQKAVAELVGGLTKHRNIMEAKKPPIVMVTKLQNKTSEVIDTQNIMDMIRVELSQSGRVSFVDKEARQDVADELEYQNSGMMSKESQKKAGGQVGADFIINGRLDSIVQEVGKDKTVYYKLTLNLTNLHTNIIDWTGQKQIRKKFKKRRVGI